MSDALLGGRYQVLRRLAAGGMAAVYLARLSGPQGFEKFVVVKRIHQHLAEQDEFVQMFLSEARLSADLRHPNIVSVLEVAEHDGTYHLVMEYLHGQDVGKLMYRVARREERIPVGVAVQIVMDAAAGLHYAHHKTDRMGTPLDIIHRDVSPQNILCTYEGVAKVLDFGIAKARGQAMETASGILKGKISYMAPEQASGREMTHRVDQFALGVVLYELTTMRRLFKRDNDIQALHAVVDGDIARPSSVVENYPPELEDIVMTALARDAQDRFPDCAGLATALDDFCTRERIPHSSMRLGQYLKGIFADAIQQDNQRMAAGDTAPEDRATQRSQSGPTPAASQLSIPTEEMPHEPDTQVQEIPDAAQHTLSLPSARAPAAAQLPPVDVEDGPTLEMGEPSVRPLSDGSDPVSAVTNATQSALVARRTNLPMDVGGFIGRGVELGQLERMFAEGTRVVTLVGPGGTGKTRLAQQFGVTRGLPWLQAGGGGIWWVDVAQARSADDICRAVGSVLNVPLTTGRSNEDNIVQLGHALAGRGRMLLVLDNFEQVVQHASTTVGAWLARSVTAQFLISSRELLHLPGETALELQPLGVPADGDDLRYNEAVQLFVARARAVRQQYTPSDEDLVTVGQMVRLLDGLPLAIELAAARMGVLPPQKLLERLGKRFDLLTGGARGGRHRTLRDAIDWSWQLLTPPEQSALMQCAVFKGGFDLEGAEAVVDLSDLPEAATVMDVVQGLREKSLLRLSEGLDPSDIRFSMYESIRAFAEEKLQASALREGALARHTAHHLSLGATLADSADGREGPAVRRRLTLEMENLLSILQRSLGVPRPTHAQANDALRALVALDPVLSTRGPLATYLQHLTTAVGVARVQRAAPSLLAPVLKSRAWTLLMQGNGVAALKDYEEALLLARTSNDAATAGRVLGEMGIIHRQQGRPDAAVTAYEEALRLSRASHDARNEALVLGNWANLMRQQGRLQEALAHYDEALGILRGTGDERTEAIWLGNVALLKQEMGNLPLAQEELERAVALARGSEDRRTEAVAQGFLGTLLFESDALDRARHHLKRSVSTLRQVGDKRFEGLFLAVYAGLEAALFKPEEARAAAEGAQRIQKELDDAHIASVLGVYDALRDQLKANAARNGGQHEEAERFRQVARGKLTAARTRGAPTPDKPKGTPSAAEGSDLVRTALRIVEKRLA